MEGRIKAGEGSLIGNAGEYYVMAELLKRGVIAALVPRNAPAFDILASKADQTVRIRVKTKTEEYPDWQWVAKEDGSIFRRLSQVGDFVVLVNLTEETRNLSFYILPTPLVDKWLKEDHERWLRTPGRGGRPHSSSNRKGT
jgi:hypothetical protein